MKRLTLIIAIALFVVGCARSLVEETPSIQPSYELQQSIPDSIALVPEESTSEFRPHHYGEFQDVMRGSVSGITLTTLEQLENESPNIVMGRMMDDSIMYIRFYDVGEPALGDNVVSFEISQVIRGNLLTGEVIRLIEPYFIYNGVLDAWASYMPSIPYQDYILFLYEPFILSGALTFPLFNGELGRFPLPSHRTVMQYLGEDGRFDANTQDFTSALFSLHSHANWNVEIYASLWEEVMNAYVLPTLTE